MAGMRWATRGRSDPKRFRQHPARKACHTRFWRETEYHFCAGAIALLTERLRWWGGVMLALYAFCVWPANIKQAIEGISVPPIPDTWLYHAPRLAFQPVLIWMALFGAKVINWPFR